MQTADVIVLGAGGVGSAAMWHLARRGLRVLGLDRFAPPHDRGSTHGQTRLIRQAYFEHPDYVPLVLRAYDLWRELEAESGAALLHITGLLEVGPADGVVVPGVRASAARHGLAVEELSVDEARRRWPGVQAPPEMQAIFEPQGGVLAVEACVAAHLDLAARDGARLHVDERVVGWRREGESLVVETDRGRYAADRLIVTAGPWAASLLGELALPLVVLRKSLFWFAPRQPLYRATDRFPAFLFECGADLFYGFPTDLPGGPPGQLKVAEHSGGRRVADPATVDREVDPEEEQRLVNFLHRHLPEVGDERVDHRVCLYTMTPDQDFVVGLHPREPRVALAAGLSGHGFKFASALGESLAQLAVDGRTTLPTDFLKPNRFASADSR